MRLPRGRSCFCGALCKNVLMIFPSHCAVEKRRPLAISYLAQLIRSFMVSGLTVRYCAVMLFLVFSGMPASAYFSHLLDIHTRK